MKLLAIETSAATGGIALLDGQEVIAERTLQLSRTASTLLLPAITELFESQSWSLETLEAIAVGVGPGSFTGVRIGVATAQGLAAAAGLNICGVPSLLGLVEQASIEPAKIAVLRAAPAQELFFMLYDGAVEGHTIVVPEGRYKSNDVIEMIKQHEPEAIVQDGSALEGLESTIVSTSAAAVGRVAQKLGAETGLKVRHYSPEYR